jgi:hypothetical protein
MDKNSGFDGAARKAPNSPPVSEHWSTMILMIDN